MAIEVQRSGSISINPLLLEDAINGDDFDLNRLPETCALDVADRGETTEIDIAKLVGTTFQRVWQIEKRGLKLAKKKSGKKGYAEFVALMEEWNDSPGSSK